MSVHNTTSRRNIVLIGQGGVGKTALAESMLAAAGAVTRVGKTIDGSSHFDFEPEEVAHGSTLKTSVFDFSCNSHSFSLLDTPGSTNFIADTISALRAADAAVLVAGAVSGLKVPGEKAWKHAEAEGLARAVFINEMDKDRADFRRTLQSVKTALDISPAVLQLPIGADGDFRGIVDLVRMTAVLGSDSAAEIPAELLDEAQAVRRELVETIVETDDALVERYLDGGEVSEQELLDALRRAAAAGLCVPVLCGSAETGIGIEELLSFCGDCLPSPAERAPYFVVSGDGRQPLAADTSEFAGIVFKTFADPYAGKISLLKIVSGELSADQTVVNSSTGASERIGKLFIRRGKEQEAVDTAAAGQIVALAKLKETRTGHTLCSPGAERTLAGIEFPESCISFAVEPKSRGDEEKMFSSMERMALEDPSLRVARDPATHETLLSGMGQVHVDLTLERMKRKFQVEVLVHPPKVPYRETIGAPAEAQGKHKKQSGGRGQYGDCWLRITPRPRGSGFTFNSEIFGGAIPKNYIPAVEKGVREAMGSGTLAGFPVVDLACTVYDGSYHAVDSSDLAFQIAAAKGFRAAVEKARPVLLEPIMRVEIVVPDDATGDVMGDLNARRGRVLDMTADGHSQVINADVPMAEMLSYAPSLRSMTADRGAFHLELSGYDEVPAHLAAKIIEEQRAGGEKRKAANA